jgi:cell wall-associated NlpC family hydrolase/LysM repeat protein
MSNSHKVSGSNHNRYAKNVLLGTVGALGLFTVGTQTANASTVTVKQGDTVWSLAQKYGVSISDLESSNTSIKKVSSTVDLIYSGQQLNLSGQKKATTTTTASASSYVVKSGDTLSAIAAKYGISVDKLVKANGIQNQDFLLVGQKLTLNASATAKTSTTSATAKSAVSATTSSSASVAGQSTSLTSSTSNVAATVSSSAESAATTTQTSKVNESGVSSTTAATRTTTASSATVSSSVSASSVSSASASSATSSSTTVQRKVQVDATYQVASSAVAQSSSSQKVASSASVASSATTSSSTAASSSAATSSSASAATSSSATQSSQQATTTTNSTTASSNTALQSGSVVSLAVKLASAGIPYVYGGNTTSGMDCSGLVQYVFKYADGVSLPHNTVAQEAYVSKHSVASAQPGDILFWGTPGNTYHDAIYIGNNQYVAAPHTGSNVQIQTISSYFMPSFAGTLK